MRSQAALDARAPPGERRWRSSNSRLRVVCSSRRDAGESGRERWANVCGERTPISANATISKHISREKLLETSLETVGDCSRLLGMTGDYWTLLETVSDC